MSKVKNRFREFRHGLGMTAIEVANQLGVREGTYLNWERGETIPLASNVHGLVRILQQPWATLWPEGDD